MPLTRDVPKPLLKVGDSTLIQRHLQRLSAAGIKRVVINVHYLAEKIKQTLGDLQFGMQIIYSEEEQLLETAGGIQAALPLLGNEPFLIVNGDIYTDYPFERLLGIRNQEQLPHLVMIPNPEHHPDGDFGLDEKGVLKADLSERLTYSGLGIYSAVFFKDLPPGREKLRPLFDKAVASGQLFGELYTGVWSDIGTPDRYQAVIAQFP